jgi:tripartite-type tricarboxylate transporter receptor subunit TctC
MRCAPAVLSVLALAGAPAGSAMAQNYVRLVVAFPPGGPSDLMARIISDRLGKELKENVVVENRAGGNGAVAAQYILHEPADGKTLWITTAGAITINPSLYPKLSYNVKDLAPVSLVVNTPEMLVVNPKNPAKDAKEFIANAAKGKQVNFASSGIGSMPHMAIELLTEQTHVQFLHVPEKGAAPAISDLMGGHVDAFVGDIPGVQALVKSGSLKGLAVASSKRSPVFPDIPTFAEQGIKGMEAINNWSGIFVSAKVPAETIQKINQAVHRTLADPEISGKLRALGVEPQATSPQELAKLVDDDTARWARIIKANNIRPE